MEPKSPAERAARHFIDGYLCSQSVLLTYATRLGIEPAMAARIAAPFGAGIAHTGRTCGAVTGALMVIGLRYGHETPDDVEAKERMYARATSFLSSFEARYGSLRCRDLLGRDLSTPEGAALAREEGLFDDLCPDFVGGAAEILEQILEEG